MEGRFMARPVVTSVSGVAFAAVAAAAVLAGSCAQLGVVSDGTSVSVGRTNGGTMLDPARVPDEGDGFWAPPTWRERGARYGVDELVDLIAAVGRKVSAQYPGSRVAIGDLSRLRGGGAEHHRSHQSGRDADFVLFYTDLAGKPLLNDTMYEFGDDGVAIGHTGIKLDIDRSWAVIRALITSPEAEVQRIFFYEPLALMVLDHARAIGEPELILERARAVLRQPGDSAKHDDHMHVRIFCPADDIAYGCVDAGDLGVQGQKAPPRFAELSPDQRAILTEPMPAMLALVGWAALR
jgi:penicillin-insensitive murein DD-endopeptidase